MTSRRGGRSGAVRRGDELVGQPALGRVVHLRRQPDTAPASAAVVAHELVHATRLARDGHQGSAPDPSGPRFFHDDLVDHEETLARRIGSLVRQMVASDANPLVPPAQLGAPAPAPGSRTLPGSRTVLGAASSSTNGGARAAGPQGSGPITGPLSAPNFAPAAGPITAAPLPDTLERLRRQDPGLAALLERARAAGLATGAFARPGDQGSPATGLAATGLAAAGMAAAGMVALPGQGWAPSSAGGGGARGGPAPPGVLPVPLPARMAPVPALASQLGKKGAPVVEPTPPTVHPSSAPGAADVLEWIVEHIEQRVLDELERRGRHHVPEVF